MAATRAYFVPGWGYINEVKGNAYFTPGWGYINETVSLSVSTSVALQESGDTFSSLIAQTMLLSASLHEANDSLSANSLQSFTLSAAISEASDRMSGLLQFGTIVAGGVHYYHKKRGQPGTIMRGTGGPQGGTVP